MEFAEAALSPISNRSSTPPTNGMENDQIVPTQRSNHVSSVLLYGIPIVSLYIEGQERLCLAQISNTLLKQFSYNEIHNRRVALGITCVQCTPVQLEILRRAGAMPVSSRRCGMITRREAERLCKSFLGDNSPPRLPDDFAFNVQHKCAWGCHGSFLPSRYNSSRAKCIKCTYCGMFFSPNKFIFHSHRISSNDRYVQPDAANFNSWRRHMLLSGQPHEEVIHAWEDVKAMFNGGTRKRLVGSSSASAHSAKTINSANSSKGSVTPETDEKLAICEDAACNKRSVDHQYNYSTVAAAAAVVGVTAVAAATVGVPFNLHRSSVLSPLQPLRNEHDLSIIPLSRNFVVDYMWQQQQQNTKKAQDAAAHNAEGCPLPWARPELSSAANANTLRLMQQQQPLSIKSEAHAALCNAFKNRKLADSELPDCNIPSVLSSSAFKPVVASTAIVSTSLYAAHSNDSGNIYISPAQSTRTTSILSHNTITTASNRLPGSDIFQAATNSFSPILDTMKSSLEHEQVDFTSTFEATHLSTVSINKASSSDKSDCSQQTQDNLYTNVEEDEDDEVVDIETTEDEPAVSINEPFNLCPRSQSELSSHSESQSESTIDIDGNTTDSNEQFEFKSNFCSFELKNRSYLKVCDAEKDKFVTTTAADKSLQDEAKMKKDLQGTTNGNARKLPRAKCVGTQRERQLLKKKGTAKLINDAITSKVVTSTKPNLHIQQRITFPVFLKSKVSALRQHHHQHHRHPSPNTLADSSNKWGYSCPVANIRQFYCYEKTSNENGIDFK